MLSPAAFHFDVAAATSRYASPALFIRLFRCLRPASQAQAAFRHLILASFRLSAAKAEALLLFSFSFSFADAFAFRHTGDVAFS